MSDFKPGDIVRLKSSKKEVGVGSVDGDDVLIMIDEGGAKPVRKWVKAKDLEAPIDKANFKAKEHWLFR